MTLILIALVGILLVWVARLRLTREDAAAAAFAEGHAEGKAEAEREAGRLAGIERMDADGKEANR